MQQATKERPWQSRPAKETPRGRALLAQRAAAREAKAKAEGRPYEDVPAFRQRMLAKQRGMREALSFEPIRDELDDRAAPGDDGDD